MADQRPEAEISVCHGHCYHEMQDARKLEESLRQERLKSVSHAIRLVVQDLASTICCCESGSAGDSGAPRATGRLRPA